MVEENNPLVSINVITYNSSKFVLETLESAKAQTYQNIELIVSDDCSTDNTVEICREWILENKDRFVRTEIVTSEKNTGISPNLNRGFKKAEGEWIKILSGDDLLVDYAIQEYYDFCNNTNNLVCFSKMIYFGDEQMSIRKESTYELFYEKYHTLSVEEKYNLLLYTCLLPMPSMFLSNSMIKSIGYIDENYPFGEEYPTYMKILERGIDMPYIDKRLVKYRCENSSLSSHNFNNDTKGKSYSKAKKKVYDDSFSFFLLYRKPKLLQKKMYLQYLSVLIMYKRNYLLSFKNRNFINSFFVLILRFLDPFFCIKLLDYIKTGRIKKMKQSIFH